ncbi:sensor histidine kinase [Lacunimicrobium album]
MPVDQIDDAIELGLSRLGQVLQIDYSRFAQFSSITSEMRVTHCYMRERIAERLDLSALKIVPWHAANRIREGKIIQFLRLPDELPIDAVHQREYYRDNDVKSELVIPLMVGGMLHSMITFAVMTEYRQWPDELMQRLWLIGQIFANALSRKQNELSLRMQGEQIVRLGRVNLMGELVAAISHEINQPLSAICFNAQAGLHMHRDPHVPAAETKLLLNDILSDITRASDIVARVRSMYQMEQLKTKVASVNAAVQEVVQLIRGQMLRERVNVCMELSMDDLLVMIDRVQLQQVILNLMVNAIDAMKDITSERRLRISTSQSSKGTANIRVSDTGPGVDKEHRSKIFDSFFTTKCHGIGVGLAISRTIIESSHGKLRLIDVDEPGATFEIELPRSESVDDEQ